MDLPAGSVAALAAEGLAPDHVILHVVVGSRAYGLAREGSDTDHRGVFVPPATLHWSLDGAPEQVEDKPGEACYWEVRKFLVLALKANPTALEVLATPLVRGASALGEELRAMREAFYSRRCVDTFSSYAASQFRKLERDQRTHGDFRWKHAMHLIRLLLTGARLLETGALDLDVTAERDRLLAIRNGAVEFAEVDAWRQRLHARLEAAAATTPLPAEPDRARVEDFLLRARRAGVR